MTPKFFMYMMWTYIAATLLCLIIEGSYFGTTETSIMNDLTVIRTTEVFGLWTVPMINIDFFTQGAPKLLMWDYSFLSGGYGIIKWFLYVLSGGFVIGVTIIFLGVIQRLFAR